MSLYFNAYAAAFWAEVTEALRFCNCELNRTRTSNGSAIIVVLRDVHNASFRYFISTEQFSMGINDDTSVA